MIFEILNPHDAYTLETDCFEAAAVALCVIGEGSYGLAQLDGDQKMPIFLFGGHDEWFLTQFGRPATESFKFVLDNKLDDLIAVLDSFLVGTKADRQAYKDGLELIDDPAKKKQWRDRWHDERRSSMSDLGGVAWAWAAKLREKMAPAPPDKGCKVKIMVGP